MGICRSMVEKDVSQKENKREERGVKISGSESAVGKRPRLKIYFPSPNCMPVKGHAVSAPQQEGVKTYHRPRWR